MATTDVDSAPTLDETAVQGLAASMRGNLIQRGDPSYDEARKIYNAMIDKHPALIAQCSNVADVIAAVNFARDNDIIVAIRGGGHNGPGLSTVDDGLVIDLSPMNGVRVDPVSPHRPGRGGRATGRAAPRDARFRAGHPQRHHLHYRGWRHHPRRRHRPSHPQLGLAIDNLLEADVVLADGSFVTANETENPDLFWALRGGGGNFGVVTSFLFKLHPISTVYAGPMLWPLERSAEVLRWYRDFIVQAPDELNGFFAFITVPSAAPFPEELWNQKMCGVVWCYTGDTPEGCSPRSAPSSDRRLSTGSAPFRARHWRPCSTGSIRRVTSGIGRPTSSRRSRTRPSTSMSHMPSSSRPEVDDASLPHRRRRRPGGEGRHRLELPGRQMGHGHGRGQPGPGRQRAHDRLDPRLLVGAAPVLGGWRLHQHDDGRGPGPGASLLRRPLRPAGRRSRGSTTRGISSARIRTSNRPSPFFYPAPA